MDPSAEETRITIAEAADYLKVSESTIHRWIRQGVIPVYRIDNDYEFKSDELEAWASYKNMSTASLHSTENRGSKDKRDGEEEIDLMDALDRGGIHYNIKGSTPEEIYRNLLERVFDPAVLAEQTALDHPESPTFITIREELFESLVEREKLASTGLGAGIAVPHPRKPREWGLQQPLFAVVFLDEPIDYAAVDEEPVYVLFIILCSTVKGHLNLLSRVTHMIHTVEMQEFLRTIPDPHTLRKRFAEIPAGGHA